MKDRARSGGAGPALLVLLLGALLAVGAWNYRRNVAAEEQTPRPYRSYADAQLEALLVAHRQEAEELARRHEAAQAGLGEVQDRAHLDQRIGEFERVQGRSEQVRELGRRLSGLEAAARDLEAEQAQREAERDRLALFLKRILTF